MLARAEAQAWVDGHVPDHPLLYSLGWRYETQKGRSSGRASVRFVPPDSIRFDYRGPFGRSGAAVVVGDSVIWSAPEEDAGGLIEAAPVFWAALGIPRYPAAEAAVSGRAAEQARLWRYARGPDTLTYRARTSVPATLEAEMRHAGDRLGFVEVEFAESTGLPAHAIMQFPRAATVVIFTFRAIEQLTSVDPDIWRQP